VFEGLAWDEAASVCSEQSGDQTQARLTSDGAGGAFVTWMCLSPLIIS
jgi:hypothetical protein